MTWYNDLMNTYYPNIMLPKYLENNLPRENIIKIIDSTPVDKAACLISPFGYGKTQAALQWLSRNDFKCAFCSLSSSDNQADILFAKLTASLLYAIGPENLNEDLLNRQEFLKQPQSFLQNIAMSVKSTQSNYSLILKNMQSVENSLALNHIRDFIEHVLGYWKVIIISQAKLPPAFNYLVITGRIRPITVAELSLNTTEVGEFLSLEGIEAGLGEIKQISVQTQGWFAALNAVVITSIEEHKLNFSDTAKSIIEDYFETNIWIYLEENVHEFLLKTSILNVLNPSACHTLTDVMEPEKMLNQLHARGVFVFFNENNEYQYHPVFKEFLLKKLEESDIVIKDLYINYGWWLYAQKEFVDAFDCFFKVKFLYGINKMLENFNPSEMSLNDILEMAGEITSLDPHELKQYPTIVVKMALIEYLTGNLERMRELKDIFLAWSEPGVLPIDSDEYANYYWESGWLIMIDPEETQKNNERINAMINFESYAPHLRVLHDARMAILGFPSIFRGTKDFSEICHDIEPFIKKVDENKQNIINDEYSLLESRVVLAEYYYETAMLTKAMEQIRMLIPKVINQTFAKLHFCCIVLLTKIMRALDDTNEINDLAETLKRKIIEKKSQFLLPDYHAFLQRNYIADGNTGFLDDFYNENYQLIDNNHFYLLYRHITYTRVLISLKKNHHALLILERLELLCKKYKRIVDLIEIHILKSIVLHNLNDDSNAVNCLKTAYVDARPYGYIRVFADEATDLMPILNLLNTQINDDYMKKILINAKKRAYGRNPVTKRNHYIDLTKTELKILKSLRQNLSYEEISIEHGIKITTVKKHTQSIYGKLGVRNKAEAIATAIRQGFINVLFHY